MTKSISANERYTAKLRRQGLILYPMWVPKSMSFKARLKKYKDDIEREFTRTHHWDSKKQAWVENDG